MGGRILFLLCKILVSVPGLLNVLAFIASTCNHLFIQYRQKVILQNLRNSFPEYSESQLHQIKNQFYALLVRYFKETLVMGLGSASRAKQLLQLGNTADLSLLRSSGRSTVLMASHFGNWEMFALLPILFEDCTFIAFYKPVSNKAADYLMQQIRLRFGVKIFPSDQAARVIAHYKGQTVHYLFIADQTPFNMNGVHWNDFLHQHTPWLTGAEKLAQRMQTPVYYLALEDRTDHSGYNLHLRPVSPDASKESTGAVTEKYARLLEAQIKNAPAYWLWSHRRWKRSTMKYNQRS